VFVSLHLSPQSRGAAEDLDVIERVIEQATDAERHGVAAVCLTEHHLAGYNGYTDPFVLGGYLAAKFSTAHVAVTVALVPRHHPVTLVGRCNLLDLLTKGKCFVAFGSGFRSSVETGPFGAADVDVTQLTNERIDAMLRIWEWDETTSEAVEISTITDQGTLGARVSPSSFRPRRPLVGRATTTDETIRATAARGMPVVFGTWASPDGSSPTKLALYRDALYAGGFDDETVESCLDWAVFTVPFILGRDERAAKLRFEDYRAGAVLGPFSERTDLQWSAEWTGRESGKAGIALTCSPQQLVDHVGESIDAGARGIRLMPIQVASCAEDQAEMLDLVYREVLPHLSPEPLPTPNADPLVTAARSAASWSPTDDQHDHHNVPREKETTDV
jgi:alkanesulfonate monooxygenase SsuD/methylene tetrahydromethanopterin reductase-like flavin-dependent oxidoreductase (luciferase family)